MENLLREYDWEILTRYLPEGWEGKGKELGVIIRKREFQNMSDVLRVILMHLTDNSSLKETALRASLGDIVDVSQVAILKKLKKSSEWLSWMVKQMVSQSGIDIEPPENFAGYNVRAIDASVVTEPGSKGTDWRLHYSLDLFNLRCDGFSITDPKVGESCTNFDVNPNDLLIGDQGYCNHKGMNYIMGNSGYFLLRYKPESFTIYDEDGKQVNLIDRLKQIKLDQVLDLKAYAGKSSDKKAKRLPVRICAIKKSPAQAKNSVERKIKALKKKQKNVNAETLVYQEYVAVVTNLSEDIRAERILELYRLRWQIEIAFKRLKSIFGLGFLPNQNPDSSRAWLNGKLLVALLGQMLYDKCQHFFPWGYPLQRK